MFPIKWNKAYRKKDGSISTIESEIAGGGGGSDLPEYDSSDAGKVLMVDDNGDLAWAEISSSNRYSNVDLTSNITATTSVEEVI